MTEEAPDFIGSIIGYRAWYISDHFLQSMLRETHIWPPKEDVKADCLILPRMMEIWGSAMGVDLDFDESPNHAPESDCMCGLYVMDTVDDLLNEQSQIGTIRRTPAFYSPTKPLVLGWVQAWGKSIRHTSGRRVEWARVGGLLTPPLIGDSELVHEVAERYDVEAVHNEEVAKVRREMDLQSARLQKAMRGTDYTYYVEDEINEHR